MAGRPQGAVARTEVLKVRMTKQGMEVVDRMRGSLSRSAYVRHLIAKEAGERK